MNDETIAKIQKKTGFSLFQITSVLDCYLENVTEELKQKGCCDTGPLMFAEDSKGFIKVKAKGFK